MKALSVGVGLTLAMASVALAQPSKLTVLTYDSFTSSWGPGPLVKEAFEAECECTLELIGAGDAAALLARLRLEGSRSQAGVVLGLDTNLMAAAEATGLFVDHGVEARFDLPVAWDNDTFLPFDWGWFAFVHDRARVPEPPASLAELAASDLKVIIQDPRSSSPGLGLVMWVTAALGDEAGAFWAALSDNIVTVTPGWSEAYSLFVSGEADMVLSYTTSPAYHLIAENDDSKAAAAFSDGHYMQVEVAGMLSNAPEPELAQRFMAFLNSDRFAAIIPETNWMYPARMPEAGLPEGFDTLLRPEVSLLLAPDEAAALRDAAVETWRNALTR